MRRWVRNLCLRHGGAGPLPLVAAVANASAAGLGARPLVAAGVTRGPLPDLARHPAPPGGWGDPWLLGVVHELAAPVADRRARGAWYTPRPVVEGLVDLAVSVAGGSGDPPSRPGFVVDPTCGGGGFLLAALDALVASGLTPSEAAERVAGRDLDPDAVQVTRWALELWWLAHGPPGAPAPVFDVRRGDALGPVPAAWRRPTLVVGNPPFASPLRRGVIPASAARYRARRPGLLGPYADLAAIHLLRAVETSAPGSTVALVQPQSVLAGRDTDALRVHLAQVAPLRALWAAREPVFDAGVRACALVLAVGGAPGDEVTLARGPAVAGRRRQPSGSWGALGADALGAPRLPAMDQRCLGDLATATAGFRDEHYALVAACREAGDGEEADGRVTARLVTVGSVEPLWTGWGRQPMRFGGQDRLRPVVDRDALAGVGRVQGWFDRQLRPKVLLATQTRLLEPFVDRDGVVVPATPLIAVHAEADQLDRVAAVLLAPPVVVWAWRRWFGTAMAIDAVKLAARQVAELPLPVDEELWNEAAVLVGGADGLDAQGVRSVAMAVARLMTRAYGASDEVFEWWAARLGPPVAGPGNR